MTFAGTGPTEFQKIGNFKKLIFSGSGKRIEVAPIGNCLAQIPQIPQTRTVQSRWCISAI
jgi:hypothetical protein